MERIEIPHDEAPSPEIFPEPGIVPDDPREGEGQRDIDAADVGEVGVDAPNTGEAGLISAMLGKRSRK